MWTQVVALDQLYQIGCKRPCGPCIANKCIKKRMASRGKNGDNTRFGAALCISRDDAHAACFSLARNASYCKCDTNAHVRETCDRPMKVNGFY